MRIQWTNMTIKGREPLMLDAPRFVTWLPATLLSIIVGR